MKYRYDVVAFAALVLACILVVWLGIAGPFVSDARSNGVYSVLKDWQTLMGVAVALLIGYIAVKPVWRQVNESQKQSAGAAIIPLMKTAETLEDERRAVFEARQAVYEVPGLVDEYDHGNHHDIYQWWPQKAAGLRASADGYREKLQTHLDRHPDTGREIDTLRRSTMLHLTAMCGALGTLSHAFAQQTSGLAYEEGDEDLPDDVLATASEKVIESMDGFDQKARQLEDSLGQEIPRVWRRVRELERIAIG